MSTTKENRGEKRNFILDGIVAEDTIKKLVEFILDINHYDQKKKDEDSSYSPKPINIIINTYGGVLYDANFAIGIIETSETPVHTYCHGKAMSAGLYIFSAGHYRYATPLAVFMYHDASVGMRDSIHGLNHTLEHYVDLRDKYDDYMLSVTKLPKHVMDEKKRLKENWFLDANEALGYSLVDEIISFRNGFN